MVSSLPDAAGYGFLRRACFRSPCGHGSLETGATLLESCRLRTVFLRYALADIIGSAAIVTPVPLGVCG